MDTSAKDRPHRPLIALAMGDPAGISPELTARLVADPSAADKATLLVIGDRRVLALGERHAGVTAAVDPVDPDQPSAASTDRALFLDLGHLDPAAITPGTASAQGGVSALENFRLALSIADAGIADAVCFTPFNKHAMRLGAPDYVDEIGFITRTIGAAEDGSEFNILDEVWNARVTSHVPLGAVAPLITREAVLENIVLTEACMRTAGFAKPRIAVAGLNPHAGDGGNFGHEEQRIIGPAVTEAQGRGLAVEGPFPADTVFLLARNGAFDAVLTMYHDQGQIAMKLIGFDRGVTMLGGYPFPITTPAHGTAYDIAGQGKANPGATLRAVALAADMARRAAGEGGFAPVDRRLEGLRAVVRRVRRHAA